MVLLLEATGVGPPSCKAYALPLINQPSSIREHLAEFQPEAASVRLWQVFKGCAKHAFNHTPTHESLYPASSPLDIASFQTLKNSMNVYSLICCFPAMQEILQN